MVTAPSRPLVHSYDPGKNPMDLVDTPSGKMERWRADAMLVGETSALTELIKQVHNDAEATIADTVSREAAVSAREQACDDREKAHAISVTRFVDFVGQAAALFDRIEKQRADAERQAAEPLAHPPGSPLPGEDDAPSHTPSGDLHAILPPKDPEQHGHPATAASRRISCRGRSVPQYTNPHPGCDEVSAPGDPRSR
jgi:hypothetical protein